MRAGLASGFLTKEEIINWADKIITKDKEPDIFFIDLALSSSKSTGDVLHYINEYLGFEKTTIDGRPLLGLIYKEYKNERMNLEKTVTTIFRLKFEAIFNDREEAFIYSIDDLYDCAKNNIYGTIEDVQRELEKFLGFYKDYTIHNFEHWQDLNKKVDFELEEDYQIHLQQSEIHKRQLAKNNNKAWWKFWKK